MAASAVAAAVAFVADAAIVAAAAAVDTWVAASVVAFAAVASVEQADTLAAEAEAAQWLAAWEWRRRWESLLLMVLHCFQILQSLQHPLSSWPSSYCTRNKLPPASSHIQSQYLQCW